MSHSSSLSNRRHTVLRAAAVAMLALLSATGVGAQTLMQGDAGVPSGYIENQGQWPAEVLYLHRSPGLDLWVTRTGLVLDQYRIEGTSGSMTRTGDVVRLGFAEGWSTERIAAHGAQPGVTMITGRVTPNGREVITAQAWQDVSLPEVVPGATLLLIDNNGRPAISLTGAAAAALVADGRRIEWQGTGRAGTIATSLGAITLGGNGTGERGLQSAVMSISSIGGSGHDEARAVARHPNGMVMFAGWSASSNFPTTNGVYQRNNASGTLQSDGFVVSVDRTGRIKHVTYLGGEKEETIVSMAIDSLGRVVVGGESNSSNFPTSNDAFMPGPRGPDDKHDGFVAILSADLDILRYATYVGGPDNDDVAAVAVAPNGDVVVAGGTRSEGISAGDSMVQSVRSGLTDAFVVRLNPTLTRRVWGTYFGGTQSDYATALVVSRSETIYLAGGTWSGRFAVALPRGFDTTHSPNPLGGYNLDCFVVAFDSAGHNLIGGGYLGGDDFDIPTSMTLNRAQNELSVVGETRSSNYPTTLDAYDIHHEGSNDTSTSTSDGFISILTAGLGSVHYSSYVGGVRDDYAYGVAYDATGAVVITGATSSRDFLIRGNGATGFNAGDSAGMDVFVQLHDAGTHHPTYSTLMGGAGNDYGRAVIPIGTDSVAVCGLTFSPTLNAGEGAGTSALTYSDAFIAIVPFKSTSGVDREGNEANTLVAYQEGTGITVRGGETLNNLALYTIDGRELGRWSRDEVAAGRVRIAGGLTTGSYLLVGEDQQGERRSLVLPLVGR